jgi:hypothetical protein
MPLISQRAYAKQRGVTHEAVGKRTATVGGPIPAHGPRELIDVDEAARALGDDESQPPGSPGASRRG